MTNPALNADATRTLELAGGRALALTSNPLVMGVVNITPDSFSDGGRYLEAAAAVARAKALIEAGADLLDLGAESTRPGGGVYGAGAREVPADEEIARLLPVLDRVRAATPVPISVDTRKAEVARAALDHGADLVNDVSALGDPAMAGLVADAGCPIVLMHSRGSIATMQRTIHFDDVVAEVRAELAAAAERALQAGIRRDRIVLDPGLGFGKTAAQNLELLRSLDRLAELGFPLLVGASRKSFIGHVTGVPPQERLPGSLAAAGWAQLLGAAILRVHDVAETVQFLRVWRSIAAARGLAAQIAEGTSGSPAA